jgi:hypothetical protein
MVPEYGGEILRLRSEYCYLFMPIEKWRRRPESRAGELRSLAI